MIANGKGLIVNTGHYGAVSYFQNPAYGAQKAGGDKMAADMAKELRPYNVAAVSIWMGASIPNVREPILRLCQRIRYQNKSLNHLNLLDV